MHEPPRILVVDDIADNVAIIRTRLESHNYFVATACDGEEALLEVANNPPDLILLDVMMPKVDGFEVVRRVKADKTLPFIPVIMLTAKAGTTDTVAGLEAGADDYLVKPVEHTALIARVRAMLRIKTLRDLVDDQARELKAKSDELTELNATLRARVAEQVEEIDRISRLKRFLAPQVAQAIMASPIGEAALDSHRADVSVLFCDLRGFTAFAETAAPEEVMSLLREYHEAVGEFIFQLEGTLERFTGDGMMVLFNDPLPAPDHCQRAVKLARSIRSSVGEMQKKWSQRDYDLAVGLGIAAGYATLGRVGFDKRFDYAAIGTVTNLAARLCSAAAPGQILVSRRVAHEVKSVARSKHVGDMGFKGFSRPTPVFEIVDDDAETREEQPAVP